MNAHRKFLYKNQIALLILIILAPLYMHSAGFAWGRFAYLTSILLVLTD